MKNIFIAFILFTITLNAKAQFVNVPNNSLMIEFTEYGYDSNRDGKLTYAEAATIKKAIVKNYNLSDFTGLEAFVNLEYLDISGNNLTNLDISVFPKLHYLDISRNKLEFLNLEKNTKIDTLICNNNLLNKIVLDSLKQLTYLNLSYNNFETINLNNNIKIAYLKCGNTKLSHLNLTENPNIENLDASYCRLSSVSFATNNLVTNVNLNANKLNDLNINYGKNLLFLECIENSLTFLDIRTYSNLVYFNSKLNPNLAQICVTDSNVAIQKGYSKDPSTSWSINCETGINDLNFENEKTIFYPNPATSEIYMNDNFKTTTIIDINGKTLITSNANRIDISHLMPGIYILQTANYSGNKLNMKLIKK